MVIVSIADSQYTVRHPKLPPTNPAIVLPAKTPIKEAETMSTVLFSTHRQVEIRRDKLKLLATETEHYPASLRCEETI